MSGDSPPFPAPPRYLETIATLTAERDRFEIAYEGQKGVALTHLRGKQEAERERDAWRDTAAQHYDNQLFYHGLVVKIGEMFGDAAKIADDGSIMEDVLALKVPLLVASALSGLSASRAREEGLREALRPFAAIASVRDIDPYNTRADNIAAFSGLAAPTEGNFRRARHALEHKGE